MPNTVWSPQDFSRNYPKVKAQGANTMFQLPQYMFWGKWMQKYTTDDARAVVPNGALKPSVVVNSPIVMHRELGKDPGNPIEIPMFREFKSLGKYGSQSLSGQGEDLKINFARGFINTIRHAGIVKEGELNHFLLKKYGIPEATRKALGMHLAKKMNFLEIPQAVYSGLNYSVLKDTSTFANESHVAQKSHPNFCTVGGGFRVTWSSGTYPGNSGYETNVATAIDAIGPEDVLSGSFLAALNAHDEIRSIPYLFTKNGKPYRILMVEPYGMYALRNDADIKALNRAGFVDGMVKDNPELTGMELFYEGWAIFDAGGAVWPIGVTSSLPVYGPTATSLTFTDLNDFKNYSSYNKFGAIVLGDNALGVATGWDLGWTREIRDHGAVEEVGYNIGQGTFRNDFWNEDDGATGVYVINESSAVIGYYASQPGLSA